MTTIEQAKSLLQSSQEQKAVELLAGAIVKEPENVQLLEVFGEALLEVNEVETAYNVLSKAVEKDPEAALGVDKFLYLGQIVGGADGVQLLDVALARLSLQLEQIASSQGENDPVLVELAKLYPSAADLLQYLIRKLNSAVFAEIEVWMTDLCMEEEAESQCDLLIEKLLALDPENPEALSLLCLIRISQQRNDEGKEALTKAWEHFQQRKAVLAADADAHDELVELVQPLIGLARFAVELAMYDVAPAICAAVSEINDNAVDAYYLEGLAHIFKAKQLHGGDGSEDYRETDLGAVVNSANSDISAILAEARLALTQGFRAVNSAAAESTDPDVAVQINELLRPLGGPNMEEILPQKVADDEDWEDEIESDDEA